MQLGPNESESDAEPTNQSDLIARERETLSALSALIRRCREEEQRAAAERRETLAELDRRLKDTLAAIERDAAQEKRQLHDEHRRLVEVVTAERDAALAALRDEHARALQKVDRLNTEALEAAERKHQEDRWQADAVYQSARNEWEEKVRAIRRHLAGATDHMEKLAQQRDEFLDLHGLQFDTTAPVIDVESNATDERLKAALDQAGLDADEAWAKLQSGLPFRLLRGARWIGVTVGIWLVLVVVISLVAGTWVGLVAASAVAFVTGFGGWWVLHRQSIRLLAVHGSVLNGAIATVEAVGSARRSMAAAQAKKSLVELRRVRQREQVGADKEFRKARQRIKRRVDRRLAQINLEYPPKIAELQELRDRELAEAKKNHPLALAACDQERKRRELEATAGEQGARSQADQLLEQTRQRLRRQFEEGVNESVAQATSIGEETASRFPPWDARSWSAWSPPSLPSTEIPTGSFAVSLDRLGEELPSLIDPAQFPTLQLPAFLPFPTGFGLLLEGSGSAKDATEAALVSLVLRLLTSVPPGKLKLGIVDPVSLGQPFAAFMHLADYDEALVSNRIWTEPAVIDQRLADWTAHMETVIQKYLRNEYLTIDDYNAQAGELAEPYRILVVNNFPVQFTETSARRLLSIATSGPRCGVHVLIAVDTKQPMPYGFDLEELRRQLTVVKPQGSSFVGTGEPWLRFPVSLDPAPPVEAFTDTIKLIGAKAKESSRVEVPFEFIAPPRQEWWSTDARKEVSVALGRSGATKRQSLRLGRGTSQHVLIAGKTGSGKSTLLHALITNLALRYSPREIELYLIDFKKGVEFKTYAERKLPHARVVAIESEREFGLSVLQRLDAELRMRGEAYREAGVQDLAGFRGARAGVPMPRVLLIVDEFQEFFTEDDKVAQEATLLLDRLVRQGRAFGIHILLGSQTLGGSYGLPRATIGQMAIRIALQCGEADAHLILSEENTAARLLGRPGEAIYNDANGLVEGNNPFQVVWLPDVERERYLDQITQLAGSRQESPPEPMLIFEGNRPAELATNHLLEASLTAAPDREERIPTAWLGDAVAIKDPTAAEFRPQSGKNLLILGQEEELARGMFVAAALALATFHPDTIVDVLDAFPTEHGGFDALRWLGKEIDTIRGVGGVRDAADVLARLSEELEQRQQQVETQHPPRFLLLFGLQRFRDLRKVEDDFGFSSTGEEVAPSPAKRLVALLREGPPLGIFVITWCDSLANLQRALDRPSQREFEQRVLMQMSANDSSQLIDSPLASNLGAQRAVLSNEEEGRLEKFRPYRVPEKSWLSDAVARWKSALPARQENP